MIAAQVPNLAFQELHLNGCRSSKVALCDKKIPEGSERPQPQIVVPVEKAPQIPDHSFQQRPGSTRFSSLPIRGRNLGH